MLKRHFICLLCSAVVLFSSCEKEGLPNIEIPDKQEVRVEYNVMDFGADNTGEKSCDAAFEKLIQSIGESRYAEIVIPAGQYKITKRIVIDKDSFSGYKLSHGLVFRGAGMDATEIICDNSEGGLFINVATNLISVTIKDLSFVASKDDCGTAIEFNTKNQNPGDHHSRMLQIRDVLIRGTKFDVGNFKNGVKCYNAWYPMLENVQITNRYGKPSAAKMEYGILFEDCYSPLVNNCYFWGESEYGLMYRGVKIRPEDGIVSDSYFVGQDKGVYVDLASLDQWPEPAFHISNCHINYKVNGMYVKGARQIFVTSNLFYCSERNGSYYFNDKNPVCDYDPVDLNLEKSFDAIISQNQFTEPASPRRKCIRISEYSSNILIMNNLFNMDGTAILNESNETSTCKGNIFGGVPDFSAGKMVKYEDKTGSLITD